MSYAVDEEGYLANINDWTPEIAEELAKDEEVELTDRHWEIINFLREYYEEFQIAPAVRVLTKAVGKKFARCAAPRSAAARACSPRDPRE